MRVGIIPVIGWHSGVLRFVVRWSTLTVKRMLSSESLLHFYRALLTSSKTTLWSLTKRLNTSTPKLTNSTVTVKPLRSARTPNRKWCYP